MLKLMPFLVVLAFATVVIADAEVPLPGPGAPPTDPAPPHPTPPMAPTPTPPPYDPNPTPYPTATPYPTPYPGNPGTDTTYQLGSGSVGRFKERSFTFRPPAGLRNLRALRITCTNEKIKIKSVTVQFKSGQTQDQTILEGLYRSGDSRISYMYSNTVTSVTVVAGTSSVLRSNGAFQLDAAASRTNAKGETGEDDGTEQFQVFEGDGGAF